MGGGDAARRRAARRPRQAALTRAISQDRGRVASEIHTADRVEMQREKKRRSSTARPAGSVNRCLRLRFINNSEPSAIYHAAHLSDQAVVVSAHLPSAHR